MLRMYLVEGEFEGEFEIHTCLTCELFAIVWSNSMCRALRSDQYPGKPGDPTPRTKVLGGGVKTRIAARMQDVGGASVQGDVPGLTLVEHEPPPRSTHSVRVGEGF